MKKIVCIFLCFISLMICISCDNKKTENEIKTDIVSKEEFDALLTLDIDNATIKKTVVEKKEVLMQALELGDDVIKRNPEQEKLYNEIINNKDLAYQIIENINYTNDKYYSQIEEKYIETKLDIKDESFLYAQVNDSTTDNQSIPMYKKPYEKVTLNKETFSFDTEIIDEWKLENKKYNSFKSYLNNLLTWDYNSLKYNDELYCYEKEEATKDYKLLSQIYFKDGKFAKIEMFYYLPLSTFDFDSTASTNPLSLDDKTGFGLYSITKYEFSNYGSTTIVEPNDLS